MTGGRAAMGRFFRIICAVAGLATAAQAQEPPSAERGKYIFDAAGCYGCHTEAGGAPLAGGPALKTAFGTFYAPNITPDPEHGIGHWSDEDFARALREGVSPTGDNLYPVFPYTAYTKMGPRDVADLRAYLKTVPPSNKPSRAHELRFPFSIRAALGPWKWLYFTPGVYKPARHKEVVWNRGAYIVEALAHCGECHTPRNFFGAIQRDNWLTGARMPVGDLVAGNLTPDKSGLADWTAADIATLLESGDLPEGGTVGAEMGEVVRNSTSHLTAQDREAVAAYLKALPPQPTTVKKSAK